MPTALLQSNLHAPQIGIQCICQTLQQLLRHLPVVAEQNLMHFGNQQSDCHVQATD